MDYFMITNVSGNRRFKKNNNCFLLQELLKNPKPFDYITPQDSSL